MSFLAPLYVLGGLAITLPILFHLIRRRPKDDQLFSSHLFLKPTPPRLTKRSRLDQWPLLLLRILAVLGLAFAFARPFVRDADLAIEPEPGKHLAILIDTSASLSRQGLWSQAVAAARSALQSAAPNDRVTLISFDRQPRVVAMTGSNADAQENSSSQQLMVSDLSKMIDELRPSSASGDLGEAVVFAADLLSKGDGSEKEDETERLSKQLLIISDFQRGTQEPLQALQSYAWPKQVAVKLHTIASRDPSNAFAEWISDNQLTSDSSAATSSEGSTTPVRIRVNNSNDSAQHDFKVGWANEAGDLSAANAIPVQVPPGTARIVSLPLPPNASSPFASLLLVGDKEPFDNVRYVANSPAQSLELLLVSDSKSKPEQSAAFFLSKVPLDDPRRTVTLQTVSSNDVPTSIDRDHVPLVVIQNDLSDAAFTAINEYVGNGGQLLWMIDSEGNPDSLAHQLRKLLGHDSLQLNLETDRDYTMWTKIDFEHPLFASFADPRFNDFTKIRFWKHWRVSSLPPNAKMLATYEDDSPAIVEATVGSGKLWLMTAGWQPTESQLALSSKFVPLVSKLYTSGIPWLDLPSSFVIGSVPNELSFTGQQVLDASGKELVTLHSPADWSVVTEPGFYYLADKLGKRPIAFNIASAESLTDTVSADEWERLGVPLKPLQDEAVDQSVRRQKRDVELEQNQGFWQWLVIAVIALLMVESVLRGVMDRRPATADA